MKAESQQCRQCKPTYERTAEHRVKMSSVLQGKPHSWRSASTRPEVADKIRQTWTPEKREAARLRGLAMAADPDWRRRIGEAVSGARNPNWEDGRSQIPYAPGWGRVNRRAIREQAGHRCQRCGQQKPLDTHHKDGGKSDHSHENLEALCRKCHKAAHAALKSSNYLRG
jgi:HNH endonuclease